MFPPAVRREDSASIGTPYTPPPAGFMPGIGSGGTSTGFGNQLTSTGRNITGPTDNVSKQYGLYGSAVNTQAKDYDTIMGGYQGLLDKIKQTGGQTLAAPDKIQATARTYTPTSEEKNAIDTLGGFTKTGGYSDADIANIRERGISPIRSIYASAQRNMDRARALQGGYSPNYAAVQAKMARELSDTIANKTIDVNAQLGQNIAQNKLAAATPYASAAGRESENINKAAQDTAEATDKANLFNIQNLTDTNKFNLGLNRQSIDDAMKALSGMQSLYGTTPALSQLFGNQAMQSAQFKNQMQQQNQNAGINLASILNR